MRTATLPRQGIRRRSAVLASREVDVGHAPAQNSSEKLLPGVRRLEQEPDGDGRAAVTLRVFDRWGQKVREVTGERLPLIWDGFDDAGNESPEDYYLFQLVSGDDRGWGKMLTGYPPVG